MSQPQLSVGRVSRHSAPAVRVAYSVRCPVSESECGPAACQKAGEVWSQNVEYNPVDTDSKFIETSLI